MDNFDFSFFSSSGMKAGVNKKDEMYNMLVDDFVKKNLSFAKCTANTDRSYFIQVIRVINKS